VAVKSTNSIWKKNYIPYIEALVRLRPVCPDRVSSSSWTELLSDFGQNCCQILDILSWQQHAYNLELLGIIMPCFEPENVVR
jgi:hypothetical protein